MIKYSNYSMSNRIEYEIDLDKKVNFVHTGKLYIYFSSMNVFFIF